MLRLRRRRRESGPAHPARRRARRCNRDQRRAACRPAHAPAGLHAACAGRAARLTAAAQCQWQAGAAADQRTSPMTAAIGVRRALAALLLMWLLMGTVIYYRMLYL